MERSLKETDYIEMINNLVKDCDKETQLYLVNYFISKLGYVDEDEDYVYILSNREIDRGCHWDESHPLDDIDSNDDYNELNGY